MKNLITKLFAIIFVIILAAGCASSITAPQDIQDEPRKEVKDSGNVNAGSDMVGSLKKPGL